MSICRPVSRQFFHQRTTLAALLASNNLQRQLLRMQAKRSFSTNANTDSDEEDAEDHSLPYIFMNERDDLVVRRSSTLLANVDQWQQFLDLEEFNIRKQFSVLYMDLLNSICQSDFRKLGEICEKTLYQEFD